MKYQHLTDNNEALEMEVYNALENEIHNSKENSKHISHLKCLKINVFDYEELVIWDDRLTFLDGNGYHYSLLVDCTLTDLIDILNKIE